MCLWCWLERLSQIGVWDVLDGGTHDGQGTIMFSSAAIGRGVHSMVIAFVPRSERWRLGCFTTDEKSVGQDYEQDRLIGLDHEWVSFVGAQ